MFTSDDVNDDILLIKPTTIGCCNRNCLQQHQMTNERTVKWPTFKIFLCTWSENHVTCTKSILKTHPIIFYRMLFYENLTFDRKLRYVQIKFSIRASSLTSLDLYFRSVDRHFMELWTFSHVLNMDYLSSDKLKKSL